MTRLAPRALLATLLAALALSFSGCEFWQYNIANGNPDGPPYNRGQEYVVSEVVSQGRRPVAMSLQEVCGSSAYHLQAELGRYGYHVDFDQLSSGATNCDGTGYGNAIVHLGNHVPLFGNPDGRFEVHFTTNYRPQHRHAMAVGIGLGNLRFLVWSAHLEAGDDSAASAQASELLAQVRQWQQQTGWSTVVGGDFNLTPNQSPMGAWCRDYVDHEWCSQQHLGEGKIDYLFSSFGWTARWFGGRTHSDHHRLAAEFR